MQHCPTGLGRCRRVTFRAHVRSWPTPRPRNWVPRSKTRVFSACTIGMLIPYPGQERRHPRRSTRACSRRACYGWSERRRCRCCALRSDATNLLDTISAGGNNRICDECWCRGWPDQPWLTSGSGDALLRAIELIGSREGDLLAGASRRAAHAIGHNSIAIAPQVKGLEIPLRCRACTGGACSPWAARGAGPQSQRRTKSISLRGGSPERDSGRSPCDRHRGQSRADGSDDRLQVPARSLRGFPRRGSRYAAERREAGRTAEQSCATPEDCLRQAPVQPSRRQAEDTPWSALQHAAASNDPAALLSRRAARRDLATEYRQRGW